MTAKLKKTICLIVLIGYVITPANAFAQDVALKNIIVTNTRDDLLVYLTVEGAFTEKMEKAVLSGVPTTFSYFIQLYRVRNFWLDEKIVEIDSSNTIKYNSLKKEFVVTRSWENHQPVVVKSFSEARKLMSEIDSLKVVPLNRLEKGYRYQLRTKAQLSKITLPFYLHYVFFFLSLWDFETDWYTIEFIY